jgi:hypothetical protein
VRQAGELDQVAQLARDHVQPEVEPLAPRGKLETRERLDGVEGDRAHTCSDRERV